MRKDAFFLFFEIFKIDVVLGIFRFFIFGLEIICLNVNIR